MIPSASSRGQTLTWDAENHLQRVTGPGVDEQYRYDESGQRLQKIVGDQVTNYVNSQYEAQQAICTGQTPAGNTNWQAYAGAGVYLDVDTRRCGFADTPLYFTTLEGTTNHDLTTGAQAIYFASATGFRVYLRFTDGRAFTPADANGWGWRLTWHATPQSLVSSQLCTGQTPAGNTNWQTYDTNGVYVDVDTRACGYTGTPLYQTSLIGANHWTVTGITALYTATPTGFRIYLRYIGGNALTPSMANGWGWQLAWNATPAAVQTPTLCSGQTPAGSTNWQANGSNSLYLDVNTAACGFTTTPRYLTALSGSNHWTILGVNAVYQPTPTGFRVYVRNNDGSALTPTAANGWGWSLTWRAVNRQYALVTQAYSFNGQRIAQRKDGVLTYLHADHLGSTLLATDAQGKVVGGNQPRYFAYGRERTPSLAALPTDYTYTGQKQDGSGLVYMNARYYDPQIGQFISPDTEVPDATNLFAYNRFMYVNGNPLRYNDPTGHGCESDGEVVPPATESCGGGSFLVSGGGAHAEEGALETVPAAKPQASTADDGGVINRIGNFFKWLIGAEETNNAPVKESTTQSATQEGGATAENAQNTTSAPCPNSFSPETPVLTLTGLEPIAAVKPGELVYAFNETTGATGLYTVTATLVHLDPVIVILTLDNEQLQTTPEHPFYSASGHWINAGELRPGDRIRKANGISGMVQASTMVQRPQVMYNLTVAQAHTFFVGEEAWLVHNNDCEKKPTQIHHYATNKSKKWTGQMDDIASEYNLDLDDEWNKSPLPHQGRHPDAYHEWVLEKMQEISEMAGNDKAKFLELYESEIKAVV